MSLFYYNLDDTFSTQSEEVPFSLLNVARVSIEGVPGTFIPTFMVVKVLQSLGEFENGLEDFTCPGAYLTQGQFILYQIRKDENGHLIPINFKTVEERNSSNLI